MTTKLIGVKEFRANMPKLYKQARKNKLRYVVMNRNKPMFSVHPLTEKDLALEKLAAELAAAREDVRQGRVYTLAEVSKRLNI